MPSVTYIEFNGTPHTVEVPVPTSPMRGAVDNNIAGIDADCGGECACATCHVYVDVAWLDRTGLPEPGSQEETMLSFAAAAQPNSRPPPPIPIRRGGAADLAPHLPDTDARGARRDSLAHAGRTALKAGRIRRGGGLHGRDRQCRGPRERLLRSARLHRC